jgi:hypothetical protein
VSFMVKASDKGSADVAKPAPQPAPPPAARPALNLSLLSPQLLAAAVAAAPTSPDLVSSAVPALAAVGCGAGVAPKRLHQALDVLRSGYARGGEPEDGVAAALNDAIAGLLPPGVIVQSILQDSLSSVLRNSTTVGGRGKPGQARILRAGVRTCVLACWDEPRAGIPCPMCSPI